MADMVNKSVVVKANVTDVYRIWSNFDKFPLFMKNIKSVTKTDDDTSHWVMQGPLGVKVEWDAKTIQQDENKRIAWKSIDGDIKTSGQVTFDELSQGETRVNVSMGYEPPAGAAGKAVADLFSNPESRLEDDLHRFKDYIEKTDERIRETGRPLPRREVDPGDLPQGGPPEA